MAKENSNKQITGIRLEPNKLGKLKHIAGVDKRTFTAVLDFAIEDYLTKWETTHGAISQEQIETALEKKL